MQTAGKKSPRYPWQKDRPKAVHSCLVDLHLRPRTFGSCATRQAAPSFRETAALSRDKVTVIANRPKNTGAGLGLQTYVVLVAADLTDESATHFICKDMMGGIALFTLLLDNLCLCSPHVLRTRRMTPGNGVPFEGDFAFFNRNLLCIHPRNHLSSMGATKKNKTSPVSQSTALIHEFGGNHMADVSRNGELRNAPQRRLSRTAMWCPALFRLPTKAVRRGSTRTDGLVLSTGQRGQRRRKKRRAADAAEAAEAAARACRKSRPRCRQQQRWRQEILMALPGPPRPPRRVRAPHLRTNYHSPGQKWLATHFAEVALAHNKNARRVPLPENVRCDPFLAVLTRRRRFWGGMGPK